MREALGKVRNFLLIMALLLIGGNLAAKEFIVVYNDSFATFSFMEQGKMVGIEVDIIAELAKRLKLKISHRGLPRSRAQAELEVGKADAFFTVTNPERLKYAHMTIEPIVVTQIVGVSATSNLNRATLMNIKSLEEAQQLKQVNCLSPHTAIGPKPI